MAMIFGLVPGLLTRLNSMTNDMASFPVLDAVVVPGGSLWAYPALARLRQTESADGSGHGRCHPAGCRRP